MVRDFLEALRFLTIVPILPARGSKGSVSLARAMFFFPLIGLLIGIVTLWLYAWLRPYLPARIATLALLIAPIWISGGLHLDGFADFCDGFFSGKNKEETLRIMKDSRIGVWAAAGVTILLLLKFELLHELPFKSSTFLAAMAASRWAQVVLSYFLPYARSTGGAGEAVAQKIGLRELIGASLFFFLATLSLKAAGLVAFIGLALFLMCLSILFKHRLGGITGDLLGAANEMTEVLIFLLVTLFYRGGSGL